MRSYHAHSISKEVLTQMDEQSLAHTRWECKYHVVFAPKYRRQVIYGKLRRDISQILIELCRRKEVEIIEAEACVDHIHMLITIPPKYSVSQIMGYLKGSVASSSSIDMRSDAFATASFFIRNRWCGCLRSIHLGLLLCDRWLYRYRDPGFVRIILPYCEREKEHHREDSSAPKD